MIESKQDIKIKATFLVQCYFSDCDNLNRHGISAHKLTIWVTQNFNVSEQIPYVEDQKTELGIFSKWPYVT